MTEYNHHKLLDVQELTRHFALKYRWVLERLEELEGKQFGPGWDESNEKLL